MRKALWAVGAVLGLVLMIQGGEAVAAPDVWFVGVVPSHQNRESIDAPSTVLLPPEWFWTARVISIAADDRRGLYHNRV